MRFFSFVDMTAKRFTYSTTEKLKSRKLLNQVFAAGKSLNVYPIKITYLQEEIDSESKVQMGVGASSRHFKKAVQRNRIKRLLRESYRLQKFRLIELLPEKKQLNAFLLFIGKDMSETALIPEKMKLILDKLANSIQNKI
jgi:ribonuclease P protein component